MNHFIKSISFIICSYISISLSAQDVVSAGGKDFIEMKQSEVQSILEGDYYVYRPSNGMYHDVDHGTLGITASYKGITLSHGFAQECYPAQGSGNITGAVTETVDYFNGKWYKYESSDGSLTYYAYLNFEIDINVMNFRNTIWTGNSTIHKTQIGRTKGVFFQQNEDGTWLYISTNGRDTFTHYTEAELKELKAKQAADQKRKEEQKKEIARKEAERKERERKAAEERKRKEEEARIRKAEQERIERERQVAYNKWHKLYLDSINAGYVRGQECVDLGLSVAWATCNIGAKKPQNKGKEMCAKDIDKNMNVQKGWRLPARWELEELFTKCTIEPIGGFLHYKYIKVVSKLNGNYIIIPNAFGVVSDGVCIRLWTSDGGSYVWKQRDYGRQGYKQIFESEYGVGDNACGYLRCVIEK